tara:strand:- start:17751 stop:18296 length:546 start_codon:yes stop_codon:yes gene_type:complete
MRFALLGKGKRRQRGVTLIELVISIVILSIAMIALMNSFSLSMSSSADPLWRNKTLKLAQLYLDEILSKNYDHNSPVGGLPFVAAPSCASLGPDDSTETREIFNDVDDYDGISEAPFSLTGVLDSSYDNYLVSIEVVCDGKSVDAVDGLNAGSTPQAKKITVTITPPGQTALPFSAYRGNF